MNCNRGVVLGIANNSFYNYKLIFYYFLKHLRKVSDLPVFVLTNFNEKISENIIQKYINFSSNKKRRIITEKGSQNINFPIEIKLLACLHSPFVESLYVDVDYIFLENNIYRYFNESKLTMPGKIEFIGDKILDKDLRFSWIFKFNKKDSDFLNQVLKDIEKYHFTDRSFFYNLKSYDYCEFDFTIYGSGYQTQYLGIENDNMIYKYKSTNISFQIKDCHIPNKFSLEKLATNDHCSPCT